jgi:hypothetical protein
MNICGMTRNSASGDVVTVVGVTKLERRICVMKLVKLYRTTIIISFLLLGVIAFGDNANAKDSAGLSLRLKDGAFMAKNVTNKTIHYFVHVHSWGCGSAVQHIPSFRPEEGIDYDGSTFKPSYFRKLAKFKHIRIDPGKTEIVWSWPGMRCLDLNEAIKFDSTTWAFDEQSEYDRFFQLLNKYK